MNVKKNILAIDSTFESCSVALFNKKKIFSEFKVSKKNHINKIFNMIKKCLFKANISLKDIDILGYCEGPGSFTGTRISVGIAQGFSFSSDLLVISVSSLLIMAQKVYRLFNIKNVLISIDMKDKYVYSICYKLKNGIWYNVHMKSLMKIECFLKKINRLKGKWGVAGSAWSNYPVLKKTNLFLFDTKIKSPDALDMLPLICSKYKKKKITSIENIKPVYLEKFTNYFIF